MSTLKGVNMVRQFKIIVEKHSDGYVAYPLGLKGIIVGEGDTYEEALADVKSAIAFHTETFGPEVLDEDGAYGTGVSSQSGMGARSAHHPN
jgi:predicted RNase H-like HicB family nuclease